LPVALGIVQSLGGAIDVQTAEDQGATFSLFFPVCASMVTVPKANGPAMPSSPDEGGTMSRPGAPAAPDPTETPNMADAPPADQRHILYLADDDTLVFLVRRLLERRGHKVTAFTEQREVIEAVRGNPGGFDLLLTDYNMPGMSGLDVAKAVLAINPALPVAVASGYITDELQAQAMAAGVREVVFKTDAVESFCEVVARLAAPRATPDGASPP
jgi:two-component system cell cycle sensor histidine kinase/response regulator CckA